MGKLKMKRRMEAYLEKNFDLFDLDLEESVDVSLTLDVITKRVNLLMGAFRENGSICLEDYVFVIDTLEFLADFSRSNKRKYIEMGMIVPDRAFCINHKES